jgi:hypothetical protein
MHVAGSHKIVPADEMLVEYIKDENNAIAENAVVPHPPLNLVWCSTLGSTTSQRAW